VTNCNESVREPMEPWRQHLITSLGNQYETTIAPELKQHRKVLLIDAPDTAIEENREYLRRYLRLLVAGLATLRRRTNT